MILTNDKGVPLEKPTPPAFTASLEEKLAYMEAMYAYDTTVRKAANEGFAKGFNQGLKK